MANETRETDLFALVLEVINPALVMGLVGSLAFFLLDVCYRGQYDDQLRWTLLFFVFAIVLVARISFTMGSEKAASYGLLLGGVTFLATMRFVKGRCTAGHPARRCVCWPGCWPGNISTAFWMAVRSCASARWAG